jgi:rod shape determining protein RodA
MHRALEKPRIELRKNQKRVTKHILNLDPTIIISALVIMIYGLFVLYSASNRNIIMVLHQALWSAFGLAIMVITAQIHPVYYRRWSPYLYFVICLALAAVLVVGHVSQGAGRWLALGPVRLQPSEFMKLILPLTLARLFDTFEIPPKAKTILYALIILTIPFFLTVKQPDLGTAILIAGSGIGVIFLSGINKKYVTTALCALVATMPLFWHFMHHYQKQRILTFLNPALDPLGSGYNIIQSKIALGSGGVWGKGWLHGTQSHLQFLPAHATDFIFAVLGEELGLIGIMLLFILFIIIIIRCFVIAYTSQTVFNRLLVGGLSCSFILEIAVNVGMVGGLLPVVGVPLPFISYGGSSIITTSAIFGIIMSVQANRRLVD